MTDGEKAKWMREALLAASHALPDTAHEPRAVLYKAHQLPAVALAVVYDTIHAKLGN